MSYYLSGIERLVKQEVNALIDAFLRDLTATLWSDGTLTVGSFDHDMDKTFRLSTIVTETIQLHRYPQEAETLEDIAHHFEKAAKRLRNAARRLKKEGP